jgi:hypothetical protein
MKALLESSLELGHSPSIHHSTSSDATIAEELRIFRAGIARWAVAYVERHEAIESADEGQQAAANLRSWSRDYFRAAVQGLAS